MKPGHEDEVVAVWRDLAGWTAGHIAGFEPLSMEIAVQVGDRS